MTATTLAQALEALKALGSTVRQTGSDSFMATCPDHNDTNPSLSVWIDTEGGLGINCKAGCDNSKIRRRVLGDVHSGSNVRSLVPHLKTVTQKPAVTVKRPIGRWRMAAAKQAKPENIKQVEVCRYPYTDVDGNLLWEKIRYEMVDESGQVVGKSFRQVGADGATKVADIIAKWAKDESHGIPLYNLPAANKQTESGCEVLVVEGEKDVETARARGHVAVTTASGGGNTTKSYSWWALEGSSMVTIVADRDDAGYKRAREVLMELSDLGILAEVKRTPLNQVKADLTDHFDAGLDLGDLEIVPADLLQSDEERAKANADHALVNLSAFLNGTHTVEKPTIFSRSDGKSLFYPGAMHSVYGQPESGKSLLVQYACAQAVRAGEHVLYVDYEDSPASVVSRMLNLLGCPPDQVGEYFHYINPSQSASASEVEQETWLQTMHAFPYKLAVLDGVIPAMQQAGLDENSNADTSKWFDQMPRAIVKASGAAVVMIDHIAKTTEGASRFAIGAQYKLGAIDGASFLVDVVKPMGKGMAGEIKMMVTKDRRGEVRGISESGSGRLQETARFTLDSSDPDYPVISLDPPKEAITDEVLGYRIAIGVSNLLVRMENNEELASENAILERAKKEGKPWSRNPIKKALRNLIANDYVQVVPGPRNAKIHKTVGSGFHDGNHLVQEGIDGDGTPPAGHDSSGGYLPYEEPATPDPSPAELRKIERNMEAAQRERERDLTRAANEISWDEWADTALAGIDDATDSVDSEPAANAHDVVVPVDDSGVCLDHFFEDEPVVGCAHCLAKAA